MIRNFNHKGLQLFAETGNGRKLPVARVYHERVARILHLLNAVERPAELAAFAGYRWHPLKQFDPIRYSMDVNGNYRITFGWEGDDATDVTIEDPH